MLILLIGHAMKAVMSVKATFESWGALRWWRLAWLVVALIVTAQTIQQHFGLGWMVKLEVDKRRITKDGDVYEWRIQHRYRNHAMEHRMWLLEDGVKLQRAEKASAMAHLKDGWFNYYREVVKFVPRDGSDPRTNNHRYQALALKQWEGRELWLPWLVLLALSWKISRGSSGLSLPSWRVRHELLWVFLIALGIGAIRVFGAGLYSDGTFTLGGQPESDASGWYNMAWGLAEGWGITTEFNGQRPFYSVMMAPFFWLPGDPMEWLRGMNTMLWALAAVVVYALGKALAGRWVAVVGALVVMIGEKHIAHVMGVLTESPGLGLGAVAVLAAWYAVKRQSLWASLVAGGLYGFANMTAGTTLLGLPALAFFFLAVGWIKKGWKHSLWIAGVFTVGASMVWLPWLLRQKVVMGIATPSTNGATLMRGGADPVHKRMWPGMDDEARQKGNIARSDAAGLYRYHMAEFKKIVAEDPVRYIKQVAVAWWECFEYARITDEGVRLGGLLLLVILGLGSVWKRGDVSGLLIALALGPPWMLLPRQAVLPLMVVSALVMLWHVRKDDRLYLVLLLLVNLGSATFLAALSGNQTATRLWQGMDWALWLLVMASLECLWLTLTAWLGRWTKRVPDSVHTEDLADKDLRWATASLWTCVVMTVLCLASTAWGPRSVASTSLSKEIQDNALAKVRAEHPDTSVRTETTMQVLHLRMTHRRFLQPAGYDTGFWLRHYGRMPVTRWQWMPESADKNTSPDLRTAGYFQAGGDLDTIEPGQELLTVSRRRDYPSRLGGPKYTAHDTLAAIPLRDGVPEWKKVIWFSKLPLAH
jgi:hypothetical protein